MATCLSSVNGAPLYSHYFSLATLALMWRLVVIFLLRLEFVVPPPCPPAEMLFPVACVLMLKIVGLFWLFFLFGQDPLIFSPNVAVVFSLEDGLFFPIFP